MNHTIAILSSLTAPEWIVLAAIIALAAVMSGLAGFGLSGMGAIGLLILPPLLVVPLLMALSLTGQIFSFSSLKSEFHSVLNWQPTSSAPYLLGGLLGVPAGLALLQSMPPTILMLALGAVLLMYTIYSLVVSSWNIRRSRPSLPCAVAVGILGGTIGGFTAFPGAAVVVWANLCKFNKGQTRAIVQPYIMGMQALSLAVLALHNPLVFSMELGMLYLMALPILLPFNYLGIQLYKRISDLDFRRVVLCLLGCSGIGIIVKGLAGLRLAALIAVTG